MKSWQYSHSYEVQNLSIFGKYVHYVTVTKSKRAVLITILLSTSDVQQETFKEQTSEERNEMLAQIPL